MPPASSPARVDAARLKAALTAPFDRVCWEALCADDLHLRIGNDVPTLDKRSSLDALEAFLVRIEGFTCGYCDLWQRREAVYAETEVCFLDDRAAPHAIPCAIVARVVGGRLRDLRFYLDPTPIPIRSRAA